MRLGRHCTANSRDCGVVGGHTARLTTSVQGSMCNSLASNPGVDQCIAWIEIMLGSRILALIALELSSTNLYIILETIAKQAIPNITLPPSAYTETKGAGLRGDGHWGMPLTVHGKQRRGVDIGTLFWCCTMCHSISKHQCAFPPSQACKRHYTSLLQLSWQPHPCDAGLAAGRVRRNPTNTRPPDSAEARNGRGAAAAVARVASRLLAPGEALARVQWRAAIRVGGQACACSSAQRRSAAAHSE